MWYNTDTLLSVFFCVVYSVIGTHAFCGYYRMLHPAKEYFNLRYASTGALVSSRMIIKSC